MQTRWRGSTSLVEQPESGEYDFNGTQTDLTVVYSGPYSVCIKNRPKRGSEIKGYAGYTVDRVKIRKQAGTKGVMTISLFAAAESITAGSTGMLYKYEIDWNQIQKPLMTHPRYNTGVATKLSETDKVAIKFWEDCPNATVKIAGKYFADPSKTDPKTDTTELTDNAKNYAAKILKGQDSYMVFNPVCRRTSTRNEASATSTAGKRENPQGSFPAALISAWTWLKTADRSLQSGQRGKWEQVEEWTGFDVIDTEIYP